MQLAGGGTVIADEAYLRESIVNPQAKLVAGFQPLMPTFQGLVSEEQLNQLLAYIKSLETPGSRGLARARRPTAPAARGTAIARDAAAAVENERTRDRHADRRSRPNG